MEGALHRIRGPLNGNCEAPKARAIESGSAYRPRHALAPDAYIAFIGELGMNVWRTVRRRASDGQSLQSCLSAAGQSADVRTSVNSTQTWSPLLDVPSSQRIFLPNGWLDPPHEPEYCFESFLSPSRIRSQLLKKISRSFLKRRVVPAPSRELHALCHDRTVRFAINTLSLTASCPRKRAPTRELVGDARPKYMSSSSTSNSP